MTNVILTVMLSWLLLVGGCSQTEHGKRVPAVKQQLEKFVKSEYEGVIDVRNESDIVTFSPDYQMILNENLHGAAIYIAGDPLMIVSSYDIRTVKVYDDFAYAIVVFRRSAHTQGAGLPGRDIIPDLIERDSVEYFLRKKANEWTVFDPPLPRISKKAMIEYYKGQIVEMKELTKRPSASKERKQAYAELTNTLNIINRLPD
jgi:hypothetical protein